jgi:hypothetical protein
VAVLLPRASDGPSAAVAALDADAAAGEESSHRATPPWCEHVPEWCCE